ncbi:hypothetical protein ASPWEDRAFT_746495 [Aspergillus wentii DTO 134E9]|uniref:Alpha/beta hydrolase fold-3 domain-containing protein n=1 Tax=Aspergillus wentii DTO 134E9 TaxID=1073089 RepID=A0A1L9R7N5_ASPWE|nr:uncharacterized protein ASPWEDRAFT_746495 [Aspergillus wentii DTO 134E9]OJJ30883.1 hypothetical protein ASPWEDRAFT_746495 [Aspergillus wentii DTO 134E9]
MFENCIPQTATRSTLDPQIQNFLSDNPNLHLGGPDFLRERQHHSQIFGFHTLRASLHAPIDRIEHTAIRGPHGTIPIRIFYPSSSRDRQRGRDSAALIYFHGGGYTVGTVDEFENGCRILAEESGVQVYAVEYRLAPEWKFPTQLDEYKTVVEWVQNGGGKERGVNPKRVCGGGDSAGGNMTAALSLMLRDEKAKMKPLHAQILLYPEARVPFDTKAAEENHSGFYLECNGIFSFADHYLPRGVPPSHPYISPGMQPATSLQNLPTAAVYTNGFDPLRDVGVEYASKLQDAGNPVVWRHFESLPHGFLQMAPWSEDAMAATKQVGRDLGHLAYSDI